MKGVEDALGRLGGVRAVRIDLQKNLVTITSAADRVLDLAAIPAAIRRAGYQPEGMRIVAAGSIERGEGQARFRIAGWPVAYPVRAEGWDAGGVRNVEAEVGVKEGSVELLVRRAVELEGR